jgi:TolB-like protein/Flp pilus assembly protein TadD
VIGKTLGPYRVQEKLGEGGMGEVYRAWDPRLDRPVAIKIVSTSAAPDRLARFEREARAAAAVSHPHVLTIFDVGVHEGQPYLVTELVEGRTLREVVAGGPVDVARAVEIARQIASGVAAAHGRGVLHRDLKPENVMVTTGGLVKVLDFGLAKLLGASGDDAATTELGTSAGAVMGTLAYMSPEQLRGEPADTRADIFAVGVVLHEMLAGDHPFRRATGPATAAAILHEPAGDVPAARRVPPGLARIVARCIAKHPAERFQSAADLVFALDAIGAAGARPAAPDEAISLAVLPFADMSQAGDHGWLCDGIADELITALTHVAGLRVAARSASFQFRNATAGLEAVGSRLGVATVLEGSVRTAGDRLRITVQLVNVADGYQRWSKRFDGTLSDVFSFQDEIARSVTEALRGIVTPSDRVALRRPETKLEAYEHYLRGRQLLHRFERVALVGAREMFERAIGTDEAYAPAHAGLADAHSWLYEWWGGTADDLEAADRASRRALELAQGLAEAHASRGFVLSLTGRYEESQAAFERARALNPNSFDAHYLQARMAFAWGRVEQAAELFKRAGELRPEDFQSPILCAQALRMLGRRDEADATTNEGIRRARRYLEFAPTDARALSLGASALGDVGRLEEALVWSNRALSLHPGDQGVLVNAACLRASHGMTEEAIDLLERAHARGWGKRDWIERDPDYDSLRDSPRFKALLASLH